MTFVSSEVDADRWRDAAIFDAVRIRISDSVLFGNRLERNVEVEIYAEPENFGPEIVDFFHFRFVCHVGLAGVEQLEKLGDHADANLRQYDDCDFVLEKEL